MVTRRGLVLGVAALAGCAGRPGGGPAESSDRESPTGADTWTGTPTGTLDLREANVTAVTATGDPGGDVRFEVTLYHDDDGESGYANWWQVETLGGDRLGRRELRHAHGTREFARSGTVAVPDGVGCVVVRGHEETHGYGGQAALVGTGEWAVRLVRQGPESAPFPAGDCPSLPGVPPSSGSTGLKRPGPPDRT